MTDIIATLGPACAAVETLADMIRAGMSVARMNFSHGDYAFHSRMASLVREASAIVGKEVALRLDETQPVDVRAQGRSWRRRLLGGQHQDAGDAGRGQPPPPGILLRPAQHDDRHGGAVCAVRSGRCVRLRARLSDVHALLLRPGCEVSPDGRGERPASPSNHAATLALVSSAVTAGGRPAAGAGSWLSGGA